MLAITADEALVRSRPLVWDGRLLSLGQAQLETARYAVAGSGFIAGLVVGDTVSLHWDWICDRLGPSQLHQLQSFTGRHLRIANQGVEHRGTAVALERYQ